MSNNSFSEKQTFYRHLFAKSTCERLPDKKPTETERGKNKNKNESNDFHEHRTHIVDRCVQNAFGLLFEWQLLVVVMVLFCRTLLFDVYAHCQGIYYVQVKT